MKNVFYCLMIFCLLLLGPAFTWANSPVMEKAVEIQSLEIIGQPHTGQVVQFKVVLLSHVTGQADLYLSCPNHITPADNQPPLKLRRQTVHLTQGETTERRFTLRVAADGLSRVAVEVKLQGEPNGYYPEDNGGLRIAHTATDFHIENVRQADGSPSTQEIQPGYGQSTAAMTEPNHFEMTGTVSYLDGLIHRGLYGSTIVLLFYNSSTEDWYHPIQAGTQLRYIHYDIIDEDGSYYFDFAHDDDLSGYDQVYGVVTRHNSGALLEEDSQGYYVNLFGDWFPTFNLSDAVVQSIDGSNSDIILNQADVDVEREAGEILRGMMLSKDYVTTRYNNNLPFSMPRIEVRIENLLPDAAGRFRRFSYRDPYIEIDPSYTRLQVVSHEYAHYVNYQMWDEDYFAMRDASRALKEGWAIFYSFATSNYANRQYGDYISSIDNCERGPFYNTPFSSFSYSDHPEYAKFACYLWSVYDNYDNDQFEATLYDNGDNDDVSHEGLGLLVFQKMRNNFTKLYPEPDWFNYHLITQHITDPELAVAIDDVYSFMFDSTPMKSAQISNVEVTEVSYYEVRFDWDSQSYPSNPFYSNQETGYKIYKEVNSNWELIETLPYGTTTYTHDGEEFDPVGGTYLLTSYNDGGNSIHPITITHSPYQVTITGPSSLDPYENGTWTAEVNGGNPPYSYQWYKWLYCLGGGIGPMDADSTGNNGNGNGNGGNNGGGNGNGGGNNGNGGGNGSNPDSTIGTYDIPCAYWTPWGSNSSTVTTRSGSEFRVKVIVTDANGEQVSDIQNVYITGATGASIDNGEQTEFAQTSSSWGPNQFRLLPNSPNPFNPSTTIRYQLPQVSRVNLNVYNTTGQLVKTLVDAVMSAGEKSVAWNGKSNNGVNVASGVYFYQLQAAPTDGSQPFSDMKRMLLLK